MKKIALVLLMSSCLPLLAEENAPTPPPLTPDELRSIYDRVAEGCKDHFDIRPYYEVAMSTDAESEEGAKYSPELVASLQSFGQTGRLELPADKVGDPIAQKCVIFAEGLVAGGVGQAFADALVKSIAEVVTDVVRSIAESLKGFGAPSSEPNERAPSQP